MTAIARRSMRSLISRDFTLAAADDLDGTVDNTQAAVVTGAAAILITQVNNGTAGTAGIDIIEKSHDGGKNWAAVTDLLAMDSHATTGTVVAGAALNAAGVEPTLYAQWKCGPYRGPTAIRCARLTTTTAGTTWVTGAPTVKLNTIGLGPSTVSSIA